MCGQREFFTLASSYKPVVFNENARAFKLSYAPQKGNLIIEQSPHYSDSEIKSAEYMSFLGKNVNLRIPRGLRAANGETSDLVIDGVSHDVYTPRTSNADNIIGRIVGKNNQANGVVVDLSQSGVNPADFRNIAARIQGAVRARGQDLNIKSVYIINTNYINR